MRQDEQVRQLDGIWVRYALGICRYLKTVHSLTTSNRALVTFAIMWAPFDGSIQRTYWSPSG